MMVALAACYLRFGNLQHACMHACMWSQPQCYTTPVCPHAHAVQFVALAPALPLLAQRLRGRAGGADSAATVGEVQTQGRAAAVLLRRLRLRPSLLFMPDLANNAGIEWQFDSVVAWAGPDGDDAAAARAAAWATAASSDAIVVGGGGGGGSVRYGAALLAGDLPRELLVGRTLTPEPQAGADERERHRQECQDA